MASEKFKHYSKETVNSVVNGKVSMRTTIVKIDTDSTGKLYGTLIIKIKDTGDNNEHIETYKLSSNQINDFRKFKITPTFDALSNQSATIPRTIIKDKRKRKIKTRKNRRNVTRRG